MMKIFYSLFLTRLKQIESLKKIRKSRDPLFYINKIRLTLIFHTITINIDFFLVLSKEVIKTSAIA